jgi:hypothetical protein
MIRLITFSLIILSIFFFFNDTHFYISILSGFSLFMIVLLKVMWNFSGIATDKIHEFVNDEK